MLNNVKKIYKNKKKTKGKIKIDKTKNFEEEIYHNLVCKNRQCCHSTGLPTPLFKFQHHFLFYAQRKKSVLISQYITVIQN